MRKSVLLALLIGASTLVGAQSNESDLVISRGGVSITLQDVDTFVARVPKEQREKFIDSPARIQDMLNNMLLTKELAEQARAAHLDQRPEVASQLHAAQDEVLARARMADFMSSMKVPDLTQLVAEQYAAHKDVYRLPASIDVRHVLVTADERSDDEAKALAEKVRAEALAQPKKFETLVEKYSEDVSKSGNHGLMSDATNEKYVAEFREAAGKLARVGEVSPVVHTSYGYHVLQLVAKHPERQQSLDEVRSQLTASMREQYIANQRRDFVNHMNNEKVDINSSTLDTLRDRYDAAGNVKVPGGQPAGNAGSKSPASPQMPH
jgi:peptidyl-prolyl cis-trans isomerase C